MEFQDFDFGRKLPHIRAKNWQVFFWGGVVIILIAVNVFVILYGRSKRQSQVFAPGSELQQNGSNSSVQETQEPQKVVNNFLTDISNTDIVSANQFISRQTNVGSLDFFISDGSKYRSFSFYILAAQVNRDKTVAEVSVEISFGSVKEYHTLTLFKEDGYWKLVGDRIETIE